jgi:threonine/homoserine/homoserine lactone efflux protein
LLLNPKALVIIALMFTQFLEPVEPQPIFAILFITTLFTVNNLIAFLVWTIVGDRLARRFGDDRSAGRINTVFALILAGVAAWMLVS